MAFIVGFDEQITEWLRSLGVADPEMTQRVIIDVPIDDVVRVYITRPADSHGFDLRFTDGDFEIVSVPKPTRDDGLTDVTSRADGGHERLEHREQD
jgi:hypothetical protein